MTSTCTDLKAAFALAVVAAAGLLAAPAHAGLLGNGSFEALAIADGANCPGVPLGNSCVEGADSRQQPDGSEIASLLFKAEGKGRSDGESAARSELTVAFVRDSFGSASPSQGPLDAAGLACAANSDACRDKLFGTAASPGASSGASAMSGGASSAFNLGFMQSVAGVQVSPQYGLSFLQAGRSAAASDTDSKSSTPGAPERWEVTYGASSQPAAAVTSMEGSSGWSSSGLQFQGTSATQVQTYMASGPSGLMGGGGFVATPLDGGGVPGVVPEPSVLMLAGAALAGLWMQRRRQAQQR